MDKRKWVTTKEELDKADSIINCFHYHPEAYLKKYNYTQDILLDFFCSQRIPICYEDYYYDDLCMSMIEELQPHIDSEQFLNLWIDLDEILEVELFSCLIIKLIKKRLEFDYICTFQYDLIYDYIEKYMKNSKNYYDILFDDYKKIIQFNRFSVKFNLYDEKEWDNRDREFLINKAEEILKIIPYRYSSILPL